MRYLCFATLLATSSCQMAFANAAFNHAYEAAQSGDHKKAIALWKPLAEKGEPAAQYALGWLYESGQGASQSYSQAIHWYSKAAEQGDLAAQYVLATMYEKGTGVQIDISKAIHWYLKAANQGDAIAQFKLGGFFQNGSGVQQDDNESFFWFEKAAKQGHISAQISLGKIYQSGRGVKQDYKLAIKWYKQAAAQGNALAQYQLANMYEYGRGVEQSYKEAKALYFKSATHYAPSAYKIAEFFELGKTGEVDFRKAREWYINASTKGNSAAQFKLGFIYENGIGVKQNIHTAIGWYINAADQDNMQAIYQLGTIYEDGITDSSNNQIIAVDKYKAAQYYQKACDNDYNLAYERLAYLYENGFGVPINSKYALSLYQKSHQTSAKVGLRALTKHLNCLDTATTKLFSVPLACSNREELDKHIRAEDIKPINEKKNEWSDTYFTGAVIHGTSELKVNYTDQSLFASARYTFVGRNKPKLIKQVKEFLTTKYGEPDKQTGDVKQGAASFTWLLDDGIKLITERGWPDTTTFVTYSYPENQLLMGEDEEQEQIINQKEKEIIINSNLL